MMHNNTYYDYYSSTDPYSYNGFDSASYVDCTLSLGTPSTRSEVGCETAKKQSSRRNGSSKVSKFCLDLLQKTTSSSSSSKNRELSKTERSNGGGCGAAAEEMRCANCDTTSTPLWRKGPKGPKSLCNACGIRYKKEERRRAASATSNGSGASVINSHHTCSENYYSNQTYSDNQTLFPAAADEHHANDAVSYLPWMLNAADRPSLVHYFTR
ncbi:unnamed protein product [Rhodiola kirilowii]